MQAHCGKSSISGFRYTSDYIQREVFENQDNHYHQMQSMQSMKIGAHVIDSWFDAGNWLWYFGLVDLRGGKMWNSGTWFQENEVFSEGNR